MAASDLLALGYGGAHEGQLRAAWTRGVRWLAGRVGADGRLDSRGNTRTCAGESFLGRDKDADLREVFRALAHGQARGEVADATVSALARWLETEPEPCEEGLGAKSSGAQRGR